MKFVILAVAIVSAASSTLAAEYKCVSKGSQWRYIANTSKGTLSSFDESGTFIAQVTNLKTEFLFGETMPPTTKILMKGPLGVEIEIKEFGQRITAEIDDDYTIVCKKTVQP